MVIGIWIIMFNEQEILFLGVLFHSADHYAIGN